MRPRAKDKKLIEEWAVPLKSVEDIYEVKLLEFECSYVVFLPIVQDQLNFCSFLHIRDSDCFVWES
jgi:hypothetical protein